MNLRRFMHRTSKDRDLADEIDSHLGHAQDANAARGLSPEEARRQARLRFGNPRTVREAVWRYRSFPWLTNAFRDLRFAIRSLARTPGFTVIALLVIAVGIGANTAVFSVVDAVILKPLTYPDPQSLVQVEETSSQGSFPIASIPEFSLWRRQTEIFRQIAAYDFAGAGMNLTGSDHPEQVQAIHVTAGYFSLLGAPLTAGRTFTDAEDSPNGGRVAVLSYGLWMKRFGGNPEIVGSTIQLGGQPYVVVGVIGRKFVTDAPADLWLPFQFDLNSREMVHTFTVIARLRPGVTIPQANARLRLVADQFRNRFGIDSLPPHGGFGVVSLQDFISGDTRFPLMVLLGAVGFVLLIACANLANLLLARASVRRRELATRAALGAGRGQIIRQLLTESLALSLAGGLLGLAAGMVGVRLLLSVSPGDIPRVGENGSAITLDLNILLFALGLSLLTGLLFGLVPAIATSRPNLAASLNESSGRSGVSLRQSKFRSGLVVTEMALAMILVVGAALLIRTFMKLEAVNLGFGTRNVLTMSMAVSGSRFQTTAPLAEVIRDGRDRLLAVPGVLDAAASNALPLRGGFGMFFEIPGRPKGNQIATGDAGFDSISTGYFSTFRIPLLRGRAFTEQDDASAPEVVIINEALARQYWPQGDPLRGQLHIGVGAGPAFVEPPRQIIGIVGNTHDGGVERAPIPMMYIPLAQMPNGETALNSQVAPLWWIVRTSVSPYAILRPLQTALRDASGGLPVGHIRSMDEVEARNLARQRFDMLLLVIFGFSGLLMAVVGVYGVMSYSVQQRTRELGVRMALGAQAWNLRNMVIAQGMTLALLGILAGTAGAFWLTRFLVGFLFGVTAWDPLAFLLTPALLCMVALFAVWIPARRATRVDPMTALRLE